MSAVDPEPEPRPYPVPESLIRELPDRALKLWVYIAAEECPTCDRHRLSYTETAMDLGWRIETVSRWADYLADLGLITVDGSGTQARSMRVVPPSETPA